jgi:ATP-dependent Clp endopeptidase proteolytic subunit ClpP
MNQRPNAKALAHRAHRDPPGFYRIANKAADTPEILLYGEIGEFGVGAEAFVTDLAKIKTNRLILRVHSVGGDAFDGMAIYNAVQRHRAHITVIIDGLAASAGSFIAMAGDRVEMHRTSELMIHDAYGFLIGGADEYRAQADLLDKLSDAIASIYSARAGGTVTEWRAAMRKESWYSSEEAVEAGLADAIVKEAKPVADRTATAVSAARVAEVREQVREFLALADAVTLHGQDPAQLQELIQRNYAGYLSSEDDKVAKLRQQIAKFLAV